MQKSVVLIGTFRKEQGKLRQVYELLSKDFDVLCPKSIDFADPSAEFLRAPHESDDDVVTIEERLLDAMRQADFVWLFAPSGYVGLSAAFEIGNAHALGIPIYTDEAPSDPLLEKMITKIVKSPNDVQEAVHTPGSGLNGLQSYYSRTSKRRGWSKESPRDTMLLLTEEIGELARAIRKNEGLSRDAGYASVSVLDELADVQLYLVHLASALGVNLSDAVTQKEIKNAARFKNRK